MDLVRMQSFKYSLEVALLIFEKYFNMMEKKNNRTSGILTVHLYLGVETWLELVFSPSFLVYNYKIFQIIILFVYEVIRACASKGTCSVSGFSLILYQLLIPDQRSSFSCSRSVSLEFPTSRQTPSPKLRYNSIVCYFCNDHCISAYTGQKNMMLWHRSQMGPPVVVISTKYGINISLPIYGELWCFWCWMCTVLRRLYIDAKLFGIEYAL